MAPRDLMTDLSNLYTDCPECSEETLHRIHKGKFSTGRKLVIDAVVECSKCSHVHHVVIDEGREVDIPIIVSRQGVSKRNVISFPGKDVINVGDDFIHDDSLVMVTSIESDGRRTKSVRAEEIDTIWAKWYDRIPLGVSINRGTKTLSKKIWAVPDEEFYVGEVVEIDGLRVALHRFKTAEKVVHKGSLQASEIVRIYGKIAAGERHGRSASRGHGGRGYWRDGGSGGKSGYGKGTGRGKGKHGGRSSAGAGRGSSTGERGERKKPYRKISGK